MGHIDIIIGVQKLIFTLCVSHDLQTTVGDHLVDVHVGRCSRTTLDHVFHKLVLELAADDFITSRNNRIHLIFRESTQLVVCQGSCLFDVGIGNDEVWEMLKRLRVEREVLKST